jgi:hypothetical protein
LKGRSIFHHEPKESGFHVQVALSNNVNLGRDNKIFVQFLPQGLHNGTKAIAKVIATGGNLNLKHRREN